MALVVAPATVRTGVKRKPSTSVGTMSTLSPLLLLDVRIGGTATKRNRRNRRGSSHTFGRDTYSSPVRTLVCATTPGLCRLPGGVPDREVDLAGEDREREPLFCLVSPVWMIVGPTELSVRGGYGSVRDGGFVQEDELPRSSTGPGPSTPSASRAEPSVAYPSGGRLSRYALPSP